MIVINSFKNILLECLKKFRLFMLFSKKGIYQRLYIKSFLKKYKQKCRPTKKR